MPRDPITDNGCKLSHLQIETAVIPRRKAERIFIEANLSAVITGIEPTVQPRLSKEINLGPELRIKKQRKTRIEKIVDVAVDESRRWLLEIVKFGVDGAT